MCGIHKMSGGSLGGLLLVGGEVGVDVVVGGVGLPHAGNGQILLRLD